MNIRKMRGFVDPLTIGALIAIAGTFTVLQVKGVPGKQNDAPPSTAASPKVEAAAVTPSAEYHIDRDILYSE